MARDDLYQGGFEMREEFSPNFLHYGKHFLQVEKISALTHAHDDDEGER